MYLIGCTDNLCRPHYELSRNECFGYACTPALASGLTGHIWSLQELLTYQIPPLILLKAREAEGHSLVPPVEQADQPKGKRGGPSKYSLILLKVKAEKERGLSHAV